jgi:F0F1-type ATP synthase assembly protein I
MGIYLRKQAPPAFDVPKEPRIYCAAMAGPERGDAWAGMSTGWAITSTLVAGMVVWGGLGLLVDRLVGTPRVFLAIGVILGAAGGTYIVYLRYGKEER